MTAHLAMLVVFAHRLALLSQMGSATPASIALRVPSLVTRPTEPQETYAQQEDTARKEASTQLIALQALIIRLLNKKQLQTAQIVLVASTVKGPVIHNQPETALKGTTVRVQALFLLSTSPHAATTRRQELQKR